MHPGLLLKFGFTEKEAALYLSLLELGSATASDLAKKAGLNRSTSYVILNPLIARGFIHATETDGVTQYVASPPTHLVSWLNEEADQRMNLVRAAETLLPDLNALIHKPRIRCYEGSTLPDNTMNASGIHIEDDKMMLFSHIENFTIVIENREIVQSLKTFFEEPRNLKMGPSPV